MTKYGPKKHYKLIQIISKVYSGLIWYTFQFGFRVIKFNVLPSNIRYLKLLTYGKAKRY